jgi:hypothetical protein
MAVMVRAVGDEPMAFIAVAAGEVVVELVDDDREKHASIGVPRRRVFARDERLFRKLCAAYQGGQHATLRTLWARASEADLRGLPPMAQATEPHSHPS